MKLLHKILIVAACMAGTTISGCGYSEPKPFPNMVTCKGLITFDGKPLDHGSVTFAPVDEVSGQAAYGKIKSGRFQMYTTVSAPGVIAGRYRVRVECLGPSPAVAAGKMPLPGPSLIPKKYTDQRTSGLEVEVQKASIPIKLELTRK